MTRSSLLSPLTLAGLLLIAVAHGPRPAAADETPPAPAAPRPAHPVPRTESPVTVDGILDEEAWTGALRLELAYETNPGENVPAPVRTELFVTYDDRRFYAAFHAYDPDPGAIRAHLSDRDRAFADDFVGVVLDTFNDERRAFEFFVNPLGVQMDLMQNDAGGGEDDSWDAIWDSAGRIVADGYLVELSIPFSSLRFPRSDGPLTWGLDAVRIYPRNQRRRLGLHPQDRNRNCYLCQASKLTGFAGISPGRNVEIAPTVTTHRTEVRKDFPDGRFSGGDVEAAPGLTASWGITPNLTLNTAVNPDFSQVETDAAQLDVNTTFALFFAEKRPFFLEGADLFGTPLDIVYTRTVADPSFGAKLTGKQGRHAVGVFFTQDERSNLLLPGSQASELTALDEPLDDERLGTSAAVLRYRYDFGQSSTVGLLFTDREGRDYSNRVLGLDGLYRFSQADSLRFQLLGSQTRYPDAFAADFEQPGGTFEDRSLFLSYTHGVRNWNVYATYLDVGREFRADLGFVPQVDYRKGLAGGEYIVHGKAGDWYTRFGFGADVDQTNEQDGTLLERELEGWIFGGGPRQSWVNLNFGVRERFHDGVTFEQKYLNTFFEMIPTGNVEFYVSGTFGDAIDFANTRPGTQIVLDQAVKLLLGQSLQLRLQHTFHRLAVDRGRLFAANLSQLRLVYQFNVRMFARAIVQYRHVQRDPALYLDEVDARSQSLGNQLLFSYKLNPQTVLFLGYSDAYAAEPDVTLTQTDRTVFLKLGYAWTL